MFHKTIILIFRFVKKIGDDRVRAHSAEAAFFVIMSVFPILMLLLTLMQYTPLTSDMLLQAIEEITPLKITQDIQPVFDSLFRKSTALVPWTILLAIWTAGKGILGLSDGLNAINSIYETKNYFTTRFRCALYTIVLILALTLSIGILVFGYNIEGFLMRKIPLLQNYEDELIILPTGIALVLLVFLFAVLYAYLPNRRLRFSKQLPGAVFTSVSWAAFSNAFSVYLDYSSNNMSVLYGSLATLIVVMLWLYFCMYLLFIGAEINLYLEDPNSFGT